MGLKRWREAAGVLEEGLKADPFNADMKAASELAQQGILKDLLEGIFCK